MALSKCALDTLYVRSGLSQFHILDDAREFVYEKCVYDFARAIEAEARKQDEALILMLVERLERADKISGYANNKVAIKAGRARLEGKN